MKNGRRMAVKDFIRSIDLPGFRNFDAYQKLY